MIVALPRDRSKRTGRALFHLRPSFPPAASLHPDSVTQIFATRVAAAHGGRGNARL